MNPASRPRRRPAWLPLLAYLLLMAVLLWLGFWQLDRRTDRIEEIAAYQQQPDAALETDRVTDARADAYRRVTARGRYDGRRQFLIDNIVRNGRNGFFVVTPMALAGRDEMLLVNRGWIPQTPDRKPIGDLRVDDAVRTVAGRVGRLPVGGLKLAGSVPAPDRWPSIRQYPDTGELATALDAPLLPWVLLLSPDEPAGYERDWRPGGLPPERHLGYAVQWFALAAALTVIAMLVTARRTRRHDDE